MIGRHSPVLCQKKSYIVQSKVTITTKSLPGSLPKGTAAKIITMGNSVLSVSSVVEIFADDVGEVVFLERRNSHRVCGQTSTPENSYP